MSLKLPAADDTHPVSSADDDLIPVQIDPDHDFVYEVPDDPSKRFLIERNGELILDMDRFHELRDAGALKVVTDKKDLEEIFKTTRAPIPRKAALAQLETTCKKLREEVETGIADADDFEKRLHQFEADVDYVTNAPRVQRGNGDKAGEDGQEERKVEE